MTRRHDDPQVDEELQHHLELRVEQLMATGLDEASARSEARQRLAADDRALAGVYASARRRNRTARLTRAAAQAVGDARFAWRRLIREPAATAFMVLTLALGIGANLASFSLIDRLLLRGPQHVTAPDDLARLYRRVVLPQVGDQTAPWIPWPTFEALASGMRTARAVEAYRVDDMTVGRGVAARVRPVGRATAGFFDLLGVQAAAGRVFGRTDDQMNPLAVVSAHLAASTEGGAILPGDTLYVGDLAHTVVGVAPEGFTGPDLRRVDVWTPVAPVVARSLNWQVIGRRASDASLDAFSSDANATHQRTLDQSPSWIREAEIIAAPIGFGDSAREPVEAAMARWLSIVSLVVLLIACANVTGLLLARLARRQREIALHIALGAGRGRLMRAFAIEGIILAGASGLGGLAVASVAEPFARRALFPEAGWTTSVLDPRLLAVVAAITFIVTVVLGALPALQLAAPRNTSTLRSGPRSGGTPKTRLRAGLTVAQTALSVMLLVGAGLFLLSLLRVAAFDLGLDPEGVVVARVTSASAGSLAPGAQLADRVRHRQLLDVARQTPGVTAASLTMGLPFDGSFGQDLHVPGLAAIPSLPGGGPYFQVVTDDYFSVMGTDVLSGRAFTAADREGSEPVVVVADTLARLFWPDRSAVGQCLQVGSPAAPCARVVGVVEDIHRTSLSEEPSLQFYLPIGQESGVGGIWIVMRTDGEPAGRFAAVRQALLDADPALTAVDLRVLADALDGEIGPMRIGAVMFSAGGALALVVAALGLYGLMAYMVTWRRHEMGVRLALGATPSQVGRMVVRDGLALAASGTAIGLALAFLARHRFTGVLFETSAGDPMAFAGAGTAIIVVALVACWVPSRVASRISPATAMRAD